MGKVIREAAEVEVTAWLDKKKVFEETRDRYKDHIEIIIEGIMNGALVLDQSTFEFTQNLLFPLGEQGDGISTLKYRARVNDNLILPNMKNVKSDDADGRLNALIATLIQQSKAVVTKLDSVDKRIATAIGIFFM